MCALKRIGPVVLVSVLALNWNHSAFAEGQGTDQGRLEENRKQLMETKSCPGCDLSGLNLDRVNLTGANLEGANLSHVRLYLATLAKANLRNADLRGAEFGGADLTEADLRGADLRGTSFAGAYLVGAQVDKDVVLNQPSEKLASDAAPVQEEQGLAPVTETREDPIEVAAPDQPSEISGNEEAIPSAEPGFFDKTMETVKGLFGRGGQDEKKAVAESAAETGKSEAVMEEIAPAVQEAAEKDGVADIVPVQEEQPAEGIPSSSEPGIFDTAVESVKGLFGQGESGEHATMAYDAPSVDGEKSVPSVDVQSPAVPAAVGENQTVNTEPAGAENKDGAIREEKPSPDNERDGVMLSAEKADPAAEIEKNRQGLLDSKACYGCNLQGVDLTGKDLDGADLEGADLTGSRLEGADLANANLKGAVLVGADLRNADLRRADLYKANLSGADLTGAKLEGALLDEAQLSDTVGYEQK